MNHQTSSHDLKGVILGSSVADDLPQLDDVDLDVPVETLARPRGRWRRLLGLMLVLALVAGSSWWASRATMSAPVVVEEDRGAPVTVVATTGQVGRSLTFNVSVQQPFALVATNLVPGVITTAHPGGEVLLGQELFQIDSLAVRAVEGSTPFYRELSYGMSGQDVLQLSRALVSLEFLAKESSKFDVAVQRAVIGWQKSLGLARTGVIARGELVAFDQLPTTVRMGKDIISSRLVSGGEEAVYAPTGDLTFGLILTQDQAMAVLEGTTVTMTYEENTWTALVSGRQSFDDGTIRLSLIAPDGGQVCGDQCSVLPSQETLSLLALVEITPEIHGVTVPVTAIRTGTDGAAYVLTGTGQESPVTVLASANGVAVVEGIEDGTKVVISGEQGTEPTQESVP